MKKTIMLTLLMTTLFLAGCSAQGVEENLEPQQAQTEQDELECPRGLEHEIAPGSCPLYRDDNKDGFCDFG